MLLFTSRLFIYAHNAGGQKDYSVPCLPWWSNISNKIKPGNIGIEYLDSLCAEDHKRYTANLTAFSVKLPDSF